MHELSIRIMLISFKWHVNNLWLTIQLSNEGGGD
jgi:hypothetical protein